MSDFEQFAFPVTYTKGGFRDSVVAFNAESDSPFYTADASHPNWTRILFGLRVGDAGVWDLFDMAEGVLREFHLVSDRYAWNGEVLTFDGDPVDDTFGNLLTRALNDGNPAVYKPLALFGEKVASNPSQRSREQMYEWLANHQFQITSTGDVVGYKSCYHQGDGLYHSQYSSQVHGVPSGYVNGVAVPELSQIPQRVGDVVTLPRSEVCDDPNQSCARGLHVGTVNYWGGFKQGLLEVHVNPRDFVSVPKTEAAKARVCRYLVARVAVEPDGTVLADLSDNKVWAGDVGYQV